MLGTVSAGPARGAAAAAVAALVAVAVLTLADSWRMALLALLAAGAVAATRIRFAREGAVLVCVLTAAFALAGNAVGDDARHAARRDRDKPAASRDDDRRALPREGAERRGRGR